MKEHKGDRGSTAVEFALVVPILLVMVLGMMEFGRAYYIQTVLSGAARDGVRVMALQNDQAAAKTMTKSGAFGLSLTDAQIVVTPASCAGTSPIPQATVTVKYAMPYVTTFFGSSPLNLTGKGVMLCAG